MRRLLRSYGPTVGALLAAVLAAGLLLRFVVAPGVAVRTQALTYDAVRRAAVQCYAIEGAYPRSLEHLKERYGVTVNEKQWMVDYRYVADNLAPDITVLPIG